MEEYFITFDKDRDNALNIDEFTQLCQTIFKDRHQTNKIENRIVNEIFHIFDENSDGLIDRNEFIKCWHDWIITIIKPVTALLIIDVQNDFISGSLDIRNCPAKHNGEDIISPINNLLESVNFDVVIYSYDWHPANHISFVDNLHLRELHSSSPVKVADAKVYDTVIFNKNPNISQKLWPRHCVQNTWGSELHKDLKVVPNAIKIYKGTNPDVDSYSAFWDNSKLAVTELESKLKAKNVTDVFVCGIAYDVCVGATAADSITSGFRTIIIDDCCRGVNLMDIEKTKNNTIINYGIIANSNEIPDLVSGIDRRSELGYALALKIKNER